MIGEKEARDKLRAMGEEPLLSHWHNLEPYQKENLLLQIDQLDVVFFHRQQEELLHSQEHHVAFTPFETYYTSGNREDEARGRALLASGKGACLILAGGQGSRLNCRGPKGCVPITRFKHKTLFQLLAEKIKAASLQVGHPLQVAIMTSPLNHVETELYFVQNAFFGLDPRQVTFFYQRMWPFLNLDGHLFLEAPDKIAKGPNGNGGVFRRLVEAGIWKKWGEMGIELVNVLPIDNPLALPFDHELFGLHERVQCEVVVKAALRRSPQEKVGLLVNVEGRPQILEYSELSEEQKSAIVDPIANLGLYSFSMPFIEKASRCILPLHRAQKTVPTLTERVNVWKFEEFIFDVLPLATSCEALLFPRESVFSPLKNIEGEGSIDAVRESLLASDRETYERVTGVALSPTAVFELDPPFYYPTDVLLEKWRGKPFPQKEYIEA